MAAEPGDVPGRDSMMSPPGFDSLMNQKLKIDCATNIFVAGCSGISRNALERELHSITGTAVRIHPMSSHDHRRAQLMTSQCVERVLALDKMCINQKEIRLIEWKLTRADNPAVLLREVVDPSRSAAELHSDHASMPSRTAVAA